MLVLSACGGGDGSANPVLIAPEISSKPQNQTIEEGQNVTFAVRAIGSGPLTYQWQRGDANIRESKEASYTFLAGPLDNGDWKVVVSNPTGSVTSEPWTLSVKSRSGSLSQIRGNFKSIGTIALTTASNGDIYTATEDGIQKIKPDHSIEMVAPQTKLPSFSSFIALDASNNIYTFSTAEIIPFTRTVVLQLTKISTDGQVTLLTGKPSTTGYTADQVGYFQASGLFIDVHGNIFTASGDLQRSKIVKYTPEGTATTVAQIDGTYFCDLKGDKIGNLYAVTCNGSKKSVVMKITSDGVITTYADANFHNLSSLTLTLNDDGDIYVTDSANHTLHKISGIGDVKTIAGQVGAPGTVLGTLPGKLDTPRSLSIGPSGQLYLLSKGAVLEVTLPSKF